MQKLTHKGWALWILTPFKGLFTAFLTTKNARLAPHVLIMGVPALGREMAFLKLYICKQWPWQAYFLYIGLSPEDSFDEAVADMTTDSVTDIKNAVIKAHFEMDEAKKVLTVFCSLYIKKIN